MIRYQCPECELIFGPLKILELSSQQLAEEYIWHYSVYEEGDASEDEIRTFNLLEPKKNKKYLNYGCGSWSKSIDKLNSLGFDV